jgi:hypothetical protein
MAIYAQSLSLKAQIGLGIASFVLLAGLILSKPAWSMLGFDQNIYITIAYDLDRHGVFSNGPFSDVDSTVTPPPPGMFFGPVFPSLVFAAMKLDPRFAQSARCNVETDRGHPAHGLCDPDEKPIRILHALLLAFAVVAVASAAQLIFRWRWMFLLSGGLALAALACETDIFSFIMTEATIFSLYSLFMFATVLAWRVGRSHHFVLSGAMLGLLCLTKPSFLLLFPLVIGLSAVYLFSHAARRPQLLKSLLLFIVPFACLTGAWMGRNLASVGKFGFTEEYGAAALIERFAYNDMSLREFFQAFPYCTPGIGPLAFDQMNGRDSMHRFIYFTEGSFFNVGRDHRNTLVEKYGRLDSLISGVAFDEMQFNWWRHLLTTIPLAWCGMWAGGIASVFLTPLFVWALIRFVRTGPILFVCFATPALANLALDALIGNHYTRYNLILIGPYAVGAAALILSWLQNRRWQFDAPGSLSIPSARAASNEDLK